MNLVGIIWNSTYIYADKIEEIISKYGKIVSIYDIDLSDNRLGEFINKIYNFSDDEKWKSDYKYNDLVIFSNKIIRVLDIYFDEKEYITNTKNRKVLKKAQELKDYIRNNFNQTENNGEIINLYPESTFHLSDSRKEYNYQMEVIKEFNGLNYVDNLESAKYYDTFPRFSKNVYEYLKKIGVNNVKVADVGSGTGRIAIDLLEYGNIVYAIDPDIHMRTICDTKCSKFKDRYISIDGFDSKMNIKDKEVDYVVVSQSFHRFNKQLFKKECHRVLKDPDNIILIWYRIDFSKSIYKDMLEIIKNDYSDYETRYDKDEINGAIIEEKENNIDAQKFFNGKSHMENILSESFLSLEEFLNLGLSLSIYPITHKMNSVSEILKQESFKRDKYVNDLTKIFKKYANYGKIKLEMKVQIHHKLI